MTNNSFSVGACPAKYQDKLFLEPTDLIEILGISENSCYRYLKSELPFVKIKIGKLIRINAKSFWAWYNELQAESGESSAPLTSVVVFLLNYHKNYRITDIKQFSWC